MAPSSPSPHPAEKPSLSSEGSTDSRHFRTLTHAASLATDDSDSQFASETDCSDSEHGSGALTVAKLKRELERERHKNSQLTSQLKRQTQLQGRLQLQAEQEEEYITNKLMKRLEALKQEKEELARQVEVEEEMITNALTKKLQKVKEEKVQLENQLEQEQEYIVNKLQKQLSAVLQEKTALETRLRENTSSILQSIQQHLARWKIDDPSAVAAGRVADGDAAASAAAAAPAAVVGHLMPNSPSGSAPPTPSSVPTVGNEDGPPPPHPAEWLPASTTAGASDADEWQRTHLLVSHLTCEIDQLGAQQERFRSECESQRQSNEKLRLELQKLQSDNASLTRRVAREREIRSAAILDRARLETELELDSERAFNNSSARSSVTSSPALSSQRGEALFPSAWSLPSPRGVTPSLLTPSVVSSVSGTLSPRAPSPKTGGGTPSRDSFSHGGHLSPKPGTPMSPKYGALSGNVS